MRTGVGIVASRCVCRTILVAYMDMKNIYSSTLMAGCCLVAFSCVNAGALDDEESRIGGVGQIRQSESDDSLVVEYDKKTGSFTVVDVEGGRTWRSHFTDARQRLPLSCRDD